MSDVGAALKLRILAYFLWDIRYDGGVMRLVEYLRRMRFTTLQEAYRLRLPVALL